MKFTKEDAIKELVARLTANKEKLNLSQRSIDEQVEALLPLVANDETEIADFVDMVYPFIKTADSNVRNDVSQGIKEYKDSNPKVEPTPKSNPKPTPEGDANAELLARLEALERKNQESELALRNQGIKNNLSKKMKELGIKNDKWIEMMLGNVSITDDFDVDAKASTYLELYNSMQADVDPSVTPRGTGGGKHDYIGDSIKAAGEIAKQQNLVGV